MDEGICNRQLPITAVNRILTTLIRARLKQGFHFAHSNQGIQTMVIELPTKLYSGKNEKNKNSESQTTNESNEYHASDVHTCVMQYIIFPPTIVNTDVEGRSNFQFLCGGRSNLCPINICLARPWGSRCRSSNVYLHYI